MAAYGEGVIVGDERDVVVFFNNRALAQVEAATGKSILAVADGFADGRTGVTDLAHILQAGMEGHRRQARAGGRPVTLNEAYEVLDEAGFSAVATTVMEAVASVLGYSNGEGPDDPNQ